MTISVSREDQEVNSPQKQETLFHLRFTTLGMYIPDSEYLIGYDIHIQGIAAGIYLLKVNNRNTRTRCEICSKLTIKTPGVFIVNFEHISHLVLVFLLLTLSW